MTRKEFQRRMRKIKSDRQWDSLSGPLTCVRVGGSGLPQYEYAYLMCEHLDRAFWYNPSDKQTKDRRVLSVLMFEQTVLAFEMYKEW